MKLKAILIVKIIIVAALKISYTPTVFSQQLKYVTITGTLIDEQTGEEVPYANVALYNSEDSTLMGGAASTPDGKFTISIAGLGEYLLQVSAVGYKSQQRFIYTTEERSINLDIIFLQEDNLELDEVVVMGERTKVLNEAAKTTFFINKKTIDAANTGMDILKAIPGIQIDLMQNINLQGNGMVIILVNGMERDRKYIQSLNPNNIDRIEIMSNPPAKYEGTSGGVINIILKENLKAGFDGHVHLEVPSSASEVYMFPTYNLSYGVGKVNFYNSYNGDFRYFHIEDRYQRRFLNSEKINEIVSTQLITQKSWSHRFNFGLDYFPDKNNRLNFYAYHNPYSREFDGYTTVHAKGDEPVIWERKKEDNDLTRDSFYSLYYKHLFTRESGGYFDMDVNFYRSRGNSSTEFSSKNLLDKLANTTSLQQNSVNVRVTYNLPINHRIKVSTGTQSKIQAFANGNDFSYGNQVHATHGSIHYLANKFEVQHGLRVEKLSLRPNHALRKDYLVLFPNLVVSYYFKEYKTLKIQYRRSATIPQWHQLNPYISLDDPFTLRSGNPLLDPVFISDWSIGYSQSFGNNWLSINAFYIKKTDAINEISRLNEQYIMETQTYNLGNIDHCGLQITSALNLNKAISLQPYFKSFRIFSTSKDLANQQNIKHTPKFAIESSLSAIVSLKHNFTVSSNFIYNSPVNVIQRFGFSDPLYFLSIEKTFPKGFKAGVTTALMFKKSFTYRGAEVSTHDFSQHQESNILLSLVPVWFKFNYQFTSGIKREKIKRGKEELRTAPGKGF